VICRGFLFLLYLLKWYNLPNTCWDCTKIV
jgi:hypothetical protein